MPAARRDAGVNGRRTSQIQFTLYKRNPISRGPEWEGAPRSELVLRGLFGTYEASMGERTRRFNGWQAIIYRRANRRATDASPTARIP